MRLDVQGVGGVHAVRTLARVGLVAEDLQKSTWDFANAAVALVEGRSGGRPPSSFLRFLSSCAESSRLPACFDFLAFACLPLACFFSSPWWDFLPLATALLDQVHDWRIDYEVSHDPSRPTGVNAGHGYHVIHEVARSTRNRRVDRPRTAPDDGRCHRGGHRSSIVADVATR